MFVRVKKVGTYRYLQIAQNRREGKRVKQSIIATLGRLDNLAASGAIDQLLRSAARFAERLMVLAEHSSDAHDAPDANVVSIGPALIFERLWRETGCQQVVRKLLATRHHHFVERAVFMTVLHRLMVSGSDRSALQWRRDQAIDGTAGLELQHLYRAMGWLGEALDDPDPDAPSPRRTKDLIEEELFARRRDLFTALDLVFFDTTSLFFTGNGGDTLGQYGKSKDHRSDCKQMVLGMVIDGDGVPVCSEMWPGNTTDVTTLDQVAQRLQSRFGVPRVCLVADAGMISKKMIAAVEARGWFYILGARLRRTKEVRDVVLSDTGAFETIEVARQRPDPMELQVKEVTVSDTPCKGAVKAPHKPRRYVVCRNPDQARKDAATREQILAALESKLRSDGPKSVVANKGYKRYLKAEKGAFAVDLDKARDEQRFDGMWVLRTNTELSAVEVALRYKQLWMVEQLFRTAKSLLDTRPIPQDRCHHLRTCLLLVPRAGAARRALSSHGQRRRERRVGRLRDLNALTETAITYNGKTFVVRSNTVGVAGKIAQCVGGLPHMVRRVDDEKESADPPLRTAVLNRVNTGM